MIDKEKIVLVAKEDETAYMNAPMSIREFYILSLIVHNQVLAHGLVDKVEMLAIQRDQLDELVRSLNFSPASNIRAEEILRASEYDIVVKRYEKLKSNFISLTLDTPIKSNIKKLQRELNLSDEAIRCITLFVYLKYDETIGWIADKTQGRVTKAEFLRVIPKMTLLTSEEIKKEFDRKSTIQSTGLIDFAEYTHTADFRNRFDVLEQIFDTLWSKDLDEDEFIFDNLYRISRPSRLRLSDYGDIEDSARIVKSLVESRPYSANILVYGPAGTGKTEFARCIAKETKSNLFEIATEYEGGGGNSMSPYERLKGYKLSQFVLHTSKDSMILFDEVDGSFDYQVNRSEDYSSQTKSWLNELLEVPGVPAFWIINSLAGIDPAFLRRFDVVVEMPIMKTEARKKVVTHYAKQNDVVVDSKTLEPLYACGYVTPANIERAMSTIGHSASDDGVQNSRDLIHIINGVLKSSGLKPIVKARKIISPTKYDIGYMNIDADANAIVNGVTSNRRGLFCFYGAPGTGKSEFAKYVAAKAGMKVLQKKVSELSSMWVGEAEKNIARAFEEAQDTKSMLLFDEADSFLSDRRGATNSWEVTQVNEMLVQMENFDGVFVATTNLMDGLDQASLRRFGMKVEFDWLTEVQALKMLSRESVGRVGVESASRIARLKALAPGDFATVKRRLETLAIKATAKNLVEALELEVSLKQGVQKTTIGF